MKEEKFLTPNISAATLAELERLLTAIVDWTEPDRIDRVKDIARDAKALIALARTAPERVVVVTALEKLVADIWDETPDGTTTASECLSNIRVLIERHRAALSASQDGGGR